MASRPDLLRPVDAEGSLRFDAPSGRSFNLVADGGQMRLELPGWEDLRTLVPRSLRGRRRALRRAANALAIHGLVLSIESAGQPVFRLGHKIAPSLLARLLGLAPALIPLSALRLLFRR